MNTSSARTPYFHLKFIWHGPCEHGKQPLMFMMPIKVHCGCGQKYAFYAEPICGRMPTSVSCPVCGEDGTPAANEVIAFTLASKMSLRDERPNHVMMFAVMGCMIAGLAGIVKAFSMANGYDVLFCLLGAVAAF